MAHIYHRRLVCVEDKHVEIRQVEEEVDYHVAMTFHDDDDENNVTEILLSKDEVAEMYDLLFNR